MAKSDSNSPDFCSRTKFSCPTNTTTSSERSSKRPSGKGTISFLAGKSPKRPRISRSLGIELWATAGKTTARNEIKQSTTLTKNRKIEMRIIMLNESRRVHREPIHCDGSTRSIR